MKVTVQISTMAGTGQDDISWFSHGLVDRTEVIDPLHRYLRTGSVRPEWCFLATTPGGNVGARQLRAAFAEAGFIEREYRDSYDWHHQQPG